MNTALTIYTVGHSNRTTEAFLELLAEHRVEVIVDVRSSPYSRYAPHFSKRPIEASLKAAGLQYLFLGDVIGGLPADDEFYDADGYVCYDRLAATDAFRTALERLITGARQYRVALMCGEEDPTGCHRRLLIARALRDRAIRVMHIRGDSCLVDDADMDSHAPEQQSLFGGADDSPPWRSLHPVAPERRARR